MTGPALKKEVDSVSKESLIEALETAERIASLLAANLTSQAKEEIARIDARGPLIQELNQRLAVEGRSSKSKPVALLKGLLGVMGRAYKSPQPCYAQPIEDYCTALRHHLGAPTGRWSETDGQGSSG